MPRDTGIADRLRAAGLNVIEVDGWRTRGSDSFNPRGSVDHHTAGGASGNAPSLRICINGRSDLPGPLCNVLVGRNNDCYVIAAGRANHAGKGGWKGLTGNSTVYGVERENVGTKAEPWRSDQTDAAAKLHAALIRGAATPDPALVCGHKEWAPGRKSDAHTITGDDLRARVGNALLHPTQGDPFMALTDPQQKQMYEWVQLLAERATAQLEEKTIQLLQEHVSNPATGGGVGSVDVDAFADELAARLKD